LAGVLHLSKRITVHIARRSRISATIIAAGSFVGDPDEASVAWHAICARSPVQSAASAAGTEDETGRRQPEFFASILALHLLAVIAKRLPTYAISDARLRNGGV